MTATGPPAAEPEVAWVATPRARAVVGALGLLTAVAWWVAGSPSSPVVGFGLVVGLALAWSFLAWGASRLPELTLWWLLAAVVVAYLLAFLPQGVRTPLAVLVLLVPPVGYVLTGRSGRPSHARVVAVTLAAVVPVVVCGLLAVVPTVTLVHALSWGYDNAAHVANVGAFLRHGTFFFLDDAFRESTFSYYRSYPGGAYALWDLFASAAGVDGTPLAPAALAALYAAFLVGSVVLFLAAGAIVVARTARRWSAPARQRPGRAAAAVTVALAVLALGSPSHLLWSGWPVLLVGYAALMSYVAVVLEGRRSPVPILVSTSVATVVVAYTYPLLLPFVLAAALGILLGDVVRSGWRSTLRWVVRPWGVVALIACLPLLYKPLIEVKRAGSGSVLVFGDIEPVGWVVAGVGLVLAAWLVVAAVRRRDWLVATVVVLGAVFAAALCAYSLVATAAVQYYPMRAAYTVVILVLLLALGVLAATGVRLSVTAVTGVVVLAAFAVATFATGLRPLRFTGAYMGSTAFALRAIAAQDLSAVTSGCGRLVVAGATSVSSGRADVAVVVASPASPVDLPSRWANALAYRMRDDNRFLTMDLDTLASDPVAFGQAIRDWRAGGGTGRIVVVADPAVATSLRGARSLPVDVDLVVDRCTG